MTKLQNMGLGFLKNLNSQELKTFKLHLAYSFIEGILAGVIVLNEFVFIKSLQGSGYQLSVLFQFSMVVFLFLAFFNAFTDRIRNRRKLLRITAIITRMPLIFLFFFPRSYEVIVGQPIYHYIFISVFLIYFLANPIIFPTINLLLKEAYRHENFGKLYSWATMLKKITTLVITFGYGLLLDKDNFAFVYVFPTIGFLGIVSVFLLSLIGDKENKIIFDRQSYWQMVKNSFSRMKGTFTGNRPFFDFEVGFMLYGFGFMASVSVITIFFDKALGLNYTSVAFYKNSYNIIAIMLIPLFGKIIGNIDPRRFAAISFLAMMLFILAVTLTQWMPANVEIYGVTLYYSLIFYILFHSIFAATMALLWSIGSAYFCRKEEAALYQSTHLSMVGIRSLFAPLIGMFFYETWGFTAAFVICMLSLLIGALYLLWSEKNIKIPVKPS